MRRFFPVLALLAAIGAASPAFAKPEDAQVGHVRAAFARRGTPLLEQPRPLRAKVVRTMPYGERFRILEKRAGWYRVQLLGGTSATGWVRMSQTVSPYTMSGAGRTGATATTPPQGLRGAARTRTGTRNFSAAEQAAAARGFANAHEVEHRRSSADVRRGYQLLDTVTARKPATAALRHFVTSGGLGR